MIILIKCFLKACLVFHNHDIYLKANFILILINLVNFLKIHFPRESRLITQLSINTIHLLINFLNNSLVL